MKKYFKAFVVFLVFQVGIILGSFNLIMALRPDCQYITGTSQGSIWHCTSRSASFYRPDLAAILIAVVVTPLILKWVFQKLRHNYSWKEIVIINFLAILAIFFVYKTILLIFPGCSCGGA